MQNTMGQDCLFGLALMNTHNDIPASLDEIVHNFSIEHPRHMKVSNLIQD